MKVLKCTPKIFRAVTSEFWFFRYFTFCYDNIVMPCYLLYVLRLTMQYPGLLEPGLMETGECRPGRGGGDTAGVTRSRGHMLWLIRIRRQASDNSGAGEHKRFWVTPPTHTELVGSVKLLKTHNLEIITVNISNNTEKSYITDITDCYTMLNA